MAEVDDFVGNVLHAVVLAFQLCFGTINATLHWVSDYVKWWGRGQESTWDDEARVFPVYLRHVALISFFVTPRRV